MEDSHQRGKQKKDEVLTEEKITIFDKLIPRNCFGRATGLNLKHNLTIIKTIIYNILRSTNTEPTEYGILCLGLPEPEVNCALSHALSSAYKYSHEIFLKQIFTCILHSVLASP